MKTEHFFENGKVYVWSETFAIVKAKAAMPDAFAVIHDSSEITVVIDQTKIKAESAIRIDRGWQMITFDMLLPLELVGFLSKVSYALAERNISIFVISAYSTDHILVKEKDLDEAIKALKELGFIINYG
jgi:hypothetical protein